MSTMKAPFGSPCAHASAPSRNCTLDPTHQVRSSLLTWSNCIKPYLIICGPPYLHLTPHLDCSTRNWTIECLTTAGSCVGVWRRCWTRNPTLHVLCMVPRSVKRGIGMMGGKTSQHRAQGTATQTPPNIVSRSQTLTGRRVWSTAHIRLVPTPTPTGVGDKCLCGHSIYIMPL